MKHRKFGTFVLSTLLSTAIGCGGVDGPEEIAVSDTETETQTTEQGLFGSDACKNTDIRITNLRERGGVQTAIKVLKVKYYSASESRWYTEDLKNEVINYGASMWWWNEDLQHAENDLLTQWRVHYKYKEADGDWSDQVYQTINTPDERCHADDDFYLTVL